jgi:four helix bundle protein
MQNPDRLRVPGHASTLAIAVYRLTGQFPSEERFGLAAQMRRAAVSIGSNIAEGCGRHRNGELLQFLYIASGSARELAFQLRLASEFEYGALGDRERVIDEIDRMQRMLNRLPGSLRDGSRKESEARSASSSSPQ